MWRICKSVKRSKLIRAISVKCLNITNIRPSPWTKTSKWKKLKAAIVSQSSASRFIEAKLCKGQNRTSTSNQRRLELKRKIKNRDVLNRCTTPQIKELIIKKSIQMTSQSVQFAHNCPMIRILILRFLGRNLPLIKEIHSLKCFIRHPRWNQSLT